MTSTNDLIRKAVGNGRSDGRYVLASFSAVLGALIGVSFSAVGFYITHVNTIGHPVLVERFSLTVDRLEADFDQLKALVERNSDKLDALTVQITRLQEQGQ